MLLNYFNANTVINNALSPSAKTVLSNAKGRAAENTAACFCNIFGYHSHNRTTLLSRKLNLRSQLAYKEESWISLSDKKKDTVQEYLKGQKEKERVARIVGAVRETVERLSSQQRLNEEDVRMKK